MSETHHNEKLFNSFGEMECTEVFSGSISKQERQEDGKSLPSNTLTPW